MNIITQLEVTLSHPVIECIFNDNLKKLKQLLKDNDIDMGYPCRECNDIITPLIAAVVKHKKDIFNFLLQQGADPNIASENDLTPLHYVSLSKAPIAFEKKLLEAKANPNGWDMEFTPLHSAAINDREDVVKDLISAGALVTLIPINVPEHSIHNKKIYQMIHHLALEGDELCSKIRYFLELEIAVQGKPPVEVFKTFDSYMLREHPQTHLTIIEMLFTVTGPEKEKYSQGSIKCLKDPANRDAYIAGAVSRFPNIPKKALAVIPQLLEQLGLRGRPDIWQAVLQALYVITQKTKGINGWDPNFIERLCKTVAPFGEEQHSSEVRIYTYGVFANLLLVEHAANIFTSVGITSVTKEET